MIIKDKIGYGYNDVTVLPDVISSVKSRSEVNPYIDDNKILPIFAAPMASVVSDENYMEFYNNNIIPVIPRNIAIDKRKLLMIKGIWISLSLTEFKDIFIDNYIELKDFCDYHICIDIANGHMEYLYELCKKAKELAKDATYDLTIMTGNIANPETYKYICDQCILSEIKFVDYIRLGIGGGSCCTTTSNVSCHYPQASLINDTYLIKEHYKTLYENYKTYLPLIIADGGIRNYSDVIKALALGADYVMIGGLFGRCIESAGEKMLKIENNYINFKDIKNNYKKFIYKDNVWYGYFTEEYIQNSLDHAVSYDNSKDYLKQYTDLQKIGNIIVKMFGMASADGQISISGEKTKTAEGITKYIEVTETLYKWSANMESFLRSAMSYCNALTLNDFIGKPKLIVNSINEINAVNK